MFKIRYSTLFSYSTFLVGTALAFTCVIHESESSNGGYLTGAAFIFFFSVIAAVLIKQGVDD